MPTIVKDQFPNNSEVCLDMCEGQFYVFVWFEGKYQGVAQWEQNSHNLTLAMAHYENAVTGILQSLADKVA